LTKKVPKEGQTHNNIQKFRFLCGKKGLKIERAGSMKSEKWRDEKKWVAERKKTEQKRGAKKTKVRRTAP